MNKVFPIAIVKDDHFLIYDVSSETGKYTYIKKEKSPMPIPNKVRAAFPIESFNNRIACVVTGDVFDDIYGYVTIFHEFVHGYQFESCELKLKMKLNVFRKAESENNYQWEINYPFPYLNPLFVDLYQEFLTENKSENIEIIRKKLKSILQKEDYEYMVWQEWKEGFARFIENKINNRLNLGRNSRGRGQPFNRVTFYAGGSHFIEILEQQQPDLIRDIEGLFHRLFIKKI
ncbi:MAG: hypothetical protein ACP5FK_09935 [bacterium]